MAYNPKCDIFDDVLQKNNLHHNEGEQALKNLNVLCNKVGYRREPYAFGSSFERFLQDNSGCVDAIHKWMAENFTTEQMEDLGWVPDEEEEEEEETDA